MSSQARDLNLDVEVILSLKSFAHLPLFSDLLSPLKLKATILRPSGREGNSLDLISAQAGSLVWWHTCSGRFEKGLASE